MTCLPSLLLRLLLFCVVVAAPGLGPGLRAQDALTARQIVDRSLDTQSVGFGDGEAQMTLLIQDASGETRQRSLTVRGRRAEGQGRHAVVRVTAPAAQAGQAYLFRENPSGEDEVHVFLPAIDAAPRRVSGSQKNGAFMGTHFTYADLESRDIRQADYTREADETIGTFPVYVIQAIPQAGSGTDYASVRLWIRQSDFIPLRIRFYDASGTTLKTLFTQETAVANGRIYARRVALSVPDGGSTTMIIESMNFDADVSAAELTPQALALP
jgi:hypothetical protein